MNVYLLSMIITSTELIEFEESYFTLGSSIAAYNNPDWQSNSGNIGSDDGKYGAKINRALKTGSPVVPGSLKAVMEEGESLLYTITVLKGHSTCGNFVDDVFVPGSYVDYLEPLKAAFREKRYTIREAVYDPAKAGGLNAQIKAATEEMKNTRSTIYRWCKANYGEIYSAWVHLKVIKGFVESVLRYGLPLNFQAMFIEPNPKREKQLRVCLTDSILEMCPQLVMKKLGVDLEEEEEDTDNLPFVCFKFPLI
jgi:V-type H+-transporting ATPase subunit C